jgi:hypothetical protein
MWPVETTDEYDDWFTDLSDEDKEETIALVELLQRFGPSLRRPHADTLKGSKHANMKELRGKTSTSVLRMAFAFDPRRTAILLVGGDKTGVSESAFYDKLIAKADKLYTEHLERHKQKGKS